MNAGKLLWSWQFCSSLLPDSIRAQPADRFSESLFLGWTAKELPAEFQTILHSWESLVIGSDPVGVCIYIRVGVYIYIYNFYVKARVVPTHSALPWIFQAVQILNWAMQSCFQSFRHESKAVCSRHSVLSDKSWRCRVRVQLLQHEHSVLPWGSKTSACSSRTQRGRALFQRSWRQPSTSEMALGASDRQLHRAQSSRKGFAG